MTFRIIEKQPQQVVSIRVIGPYAETIPLGFKQLSSWQQQHPLPYESWLALYWDNPETTPPANLRADVAFSVADDFVLPAHASSGVLLQIIPGGTYAVYRARVTDGDYAKAWGELYNLHLPASGYLPAEGACFEVYLNDGMADGYFDIDIYQSVRPMDTE
ncbi:2-hydroxyacid dehydrogenase [Yersinia entomophaga]|uniref:DNA gyrase inhibitor n=1 Tax=Yersinia entomophaga TaxID=935293 RepID=A0ABM6BJD2_YERET|nr:DNA gyrase inhibitor SbmC [Yersinia entomophaga]ANI29274.1 2-hydroxyacid dehydrogenase [Yersinia entomophaga]OWF89125.1 hydroxyacid dehydrogenase [Yersinia entomophaga]